MSFGIIVPAVDGTNNSGPLSPTIDGLPTGGLPPAANVGKEENMPPKVELKNVFIPSLNKSLAIPCKRPLAASASD